MSYDNLTEKKSGRERSCVNFETLLNGQIKTNISPIFLDAGLMFADREPRWFCKIRMGFGLTERMISDLKIVIWKLVWKIFKSRGSREGRSFIRHSVDRELFTIDRMVRPTLLKNILQKSGTFHLKDWMRALIWQMCPLSACERLRLRLLINVNNTLLLLNGRIHPAEQK